MTNVYNSEPHKLLFLERDLEVITVKKVLYTEIGDFFFNKLKFIN